MSFEIMTELSCNLPEDMLEDFNLHLTSLSYIVNGKEYPSLRPSDSEGHKRFYQSMRDGEIIKTSLVTRKTVIDVAEPLLSAGKNILYLGFSSSLSGAFDITNQTLVELQEKYPGTQVKSIDTLAAAGGFGLLVRKAALMRNAGHSLEETYQEVLNTRMKIGHWFVVDDLMFLSRGGRLSKGSAFMGSMLNIKPVLHMDKEGKLVPVDKARGKKKALQKIVDQMVETGADNIADEPILIGHGDALEDAEYLADLVRKQFGNPEIRIDYLDPVIGAHTGPGLVTIFFASTKR